MPHWWPMTKEGAERLQRYLGRTWTGFLLAGGLGLAIGYGIKRNRSDNVVNNKNEGEAQ